MTVWQWLFDSQYGVINWVLANVFGLEDMAGHSWIIEPLSFYFVATVIVVWMSVPFVAFSVYAGLLQVPEETMEAAQLDGASAAAAVLEHHDADDPAGPVDRAAAAGDLGLQGVHADLRAPARRRARRARPTCSAPSSTPTPSEFSLAGALATIMLVLTLALTGFYIRQMLKEDEL